MNKIILIIILITLLGFSFSFLSTKSEDNIAKQETKQENASKILAGKRATVYKSPTCGCCAGYVDFLEKNGVEVETVESQTLFEFKEEFGVPSSQESCHTTVFEDSYVVEGHVPLDTLEKLFTEKPDIKGIALPNMPIGTPGMEGPKTGSFKTEILGEEKKIYDEI